MKRGCHPGEHPANHSRGDSRVELFVNNQAICQRNVPQQISSSTAAAAAAAALRPCPDAERVEETWRKSVKTSERTETQLLEDLRTG